MEKNWFDSKTIWAGIALIIKAIAFDYYYLGDISSASSNFFAGLGLIGLRQAIK